MKLAGGDAEGPEDVGDFLSGLATPGVPRSIFAKGKSGQQIFGREIFGIPVEEEYCPDIAEQLGVHGAWSLLEDGVDCSACFLWPVPSYGVGDMNERFSAVLLAGRESSGNSQRRFVGFFDEPVRVVADRVEPSEQLS